MYSLAFTLANVAYRVSLLYWLTYIFYMYRIPLLYWLFARSSLRRISSLYTDTQFVEKRNLSMSR